jgi:Lipid A 3-O-deacylase (PagL)
LHFYRFILFLLLANTYCVAQNNIASKSLLSYSVIGHYGNTIVHSNFVENVRGANPKGIEVEVDFLKTDLASVYKFNCYPSQGFVISIFDYDNKILGSVCNIGYFCKSNFILNKNASFYFKSAIGIGLVSNPFDSVLNPNNRSYSLPTNVLLQLGLGLRYSIAKHISFNAAVNLLHNSNGGLNKPNRGVNYATISLGISYHIGNSAIKKNQGLAHYKPAITNKKLQWQIKAFMATKNIDSIFYNEKFTNIYGINFKGIKPLNSLHNLSLGVEICWDYELEALNKYHNFSNNNILGAVTIGHEFVCNNWIFSQEFGFYVFNNLNPVQQRFKTYFPIMHHWGITRKISKNLWLGGGFKAHKQIADFIDVHAIVRW